MRHCLSLRCWALLFIFCFPKRKSLFKQTNIFNQYILSDAVQLRDISWCSQKVSPLLIVSKSGQGIRNNKTWNFEDCPFC